MSRIINLAWRFRYFFMNSHAIDYINGVLYELENGETSKPSSKEDLDSAITFTARTSGKRTFVIIELVEKLNQRVCRHEYSDKRSKHQK